MIQQHCYQISFPVLPFPFSFHHDAAFANLFITAEVDIYFLMCCLMMLQRCWRICCHFHLYFHCLHWWCRSLFVKFGSHCCHFYFYFYYLHWCCLLQPCCQIWFPLLLFLFIFLLPPLNMQKLYFKFGSHCCHFNLYFYCLHWCCLLQPHCQFLFPLLPFPFIFLLPPLMMQKPCFQIWFPLLPFPFHFSCMIFFEFVIVQKIRWKLYQSTYELLYLRIFQCFKVGMEFSWFY